MRSSGDPMSEELSLFERPAAEDVLSGCRILRGYFDTAEADRYFKELRNADHWRQETIQMYGKSTPIPRLTAWYGDPNQIYTYSGIRMSPLPWSEVMSELRKRVEKAAETIFNSALLNLYRDGRDSVAWHADDEPELGDQPVIGSVSLGATRRFQFGQPKDRPSVKHSIDLEHGDVLVMSGDVQQSWAHQVPKTKRPVGPRINLTFRRIQMSHLDVASVDDPSS